jgi:putative addiction module component (TIGR02574 family)
MSPDFAELFSLERAERLQLVEDLWDSIAKEESHVPLSDWRIQELQARKERFMANPDSGRSWEQIKRRARGQDD